MQLFEKRHPNLVPRKFHRAIYGLVIVGLLGYSMAQAQANDSEAETGIGGLTLTESKNVTMDREDLFISATKVTVKYRFTNQSDKDIRSLIAFPLPMLPGEFGRSANLSDYEAMPDFSDFKFTTTVDGQAATLGNATTVTIAGRSVERRLKELNWPIRWFNDEEFVASLQSLDGASKQSFLAEGLLLKMADGQLAPAWDVTMNFTRTQIFPAHRTVVVEHNYSPESGGSVGGGFTRDPASYRTKYCADKSFYRDFNARQAKRDDPSRYAETWLSYILHSGANWKGPIKDFRLVVDKGDPTNLVSFCMNGVKKISPTRFEVRKRNFEPTKDLEILIVS